MSKTSETVRAVERTIQAEGHPKDWTYPQAAALFATLPEKRLFDGVQDFVAACFVHAHATGLSRYSPVQYN